MWHPFIAYLNYLYRSKTKFSVHSPFVFELVTKVLSPELPTQYSLKLAEYRKDLLSNDKFIEVSDFGAGSKVFKSNKRKISDIVKIAGINKTKANLLQKIIFHLQPKSILELGTSVGIGTAAMRIVAPEADITSVEGCKETAKIANTNFKKHQLQNIQLEIGEFSKTLPNLFQNNTYDLIYFDGNHQEKTTISYFVDSLPSIHNDTLFIFDDIHWSKGMEKAWEFIKNEHNVTLSIDLFHLGLVFFRKEQVKQDFILRY